MLFNLLESEERYRLRQSRDLLFPQPLLLYLLGLITDSLNKPPT